MQKKGKKEAKILFVTSNKHKFSEAERILKEYGISIARFPTRYPEVRAEECGAVASAAASELYRKLKQPLILEDAGLFVKALNGFPGAYSAWAHGKIGNRGILRLMKGAKGRRAEFHSVYAFATSGGLELFEGVCKGKIARAEAGKCGFGYDPIFVPDEGAGRTFASDPETKERVSHRRKALVKLAEYLKKLKGDW